MALETRGELVSIGRWKVHASLFTALAKCHLHLVKDTERIEGIGKLLQKDVFPDPETRDFILRVLAWGGPTGNLVRPQVLANSPDWIRSSFLAALEALSCTPPDGATAIARVMGRCGGIKGLGMSFGSKHLRFLRPDICPILDERISTVLNYSRDYSSEYQRYSDDALRIAGLLKELSIPNPMNRDCGSWYAADVDMGLFAYVQIQSNAEGWEGGRALISRSPRPSRL